MSFADDLARKKAEYARLQAMLNEPMPSEILAGRKEYVRTVPATPDSADAEAAVREVLATGTPMEIQWTPPSTEDAAVRRADARKAAGLEDAGLVGFNTFPDSKWPEDVAFPDPRDIGVDWGKEEIPEPPPPPASDIPKLLLAPLSFLSGAGGVGKTYLCREWVRQHPGTVLAATTGIAAVNLGEGTTINALLKYFDTNSLMDSHVNGHLTAILGKHYKAGVRRILLDEVSMLDERQLTCLVRSLQQLAGRGYTMDVKLTDEVQQQMDEEGLNPEEHLPIGLTLVGDFAQLPPVKAEYAFESPEWPAFEAHTHRLTKVWRQDDQDFIAALMAARRGDKEPVVEFFRSRLVPQQDHHFEGTTVLGKNESVDAFNALRMDAHKGSWARYSATRWGTQRGDWKNIPDVLSLKVGALVMILANKREKGVDGEPGPLVYANGDLGEIEACGSDRVHVRLQRTGEVVEVDYLERQNTIPLEPGRRGELKAARQEHLLKDKEEIVGTVRYIPLRVAYATTVHKSQGLTLDHVQVNTREGMFKQPGLLYVAMSRCRTADGLRLVGSVDGLASRVTVHPKVRRWL